MDSLPASRLLPCLRRKYLPLFLPNQLTPMRVLLFLLLLLLLLRPLPPLPPLSLVLVAVLGLRRN